jgi:CHAD domain-containing protein
MRAQRAPALEGRVTHWDTQDLRLARWGIALRHRPGEGWRLSLPGANGAKPPADGTTELTFAGGPGRPPAKAKDLVLGYVRHADLAPVYRGPEVDRPTPATPTAPDIAGRAQAGEVIRRALGSSVVRLLRHDPGVRIGRDPEDVHQARVATRRLRSDLRTFSPLLQRKWAEKLREELRWLGAELGRVRDAEVLRDRMAAAVERLPEEDRAAAREVVMPLETEVRSARRQLLAGMRSPRYLDLVDHLLAAAETPQLAEAGRRSAAKVIPRLVRRPWRQLRKRARRSGVDSPDAELHDLRIRAKRCRYAAEAAARVAGKPAAGLARSCAGLQDLLGEWHDGVVAEAWLRKRSTSPQLTAGEEFAAGELAALQRAEAAQTRTRWPRAWRRIAQRKRSWMK